MQLDSASKSININLSHNSGNGVKKSILKKIISSLTVVLVILLIIFGVFTLSSKYIDYNAVALSYGLNIDNFIEFNTNTRKFNEDTLTYYTQDELAMLGVLNLPTSHQVQTEYKGIKFVKSKSKSFTQTQIDLLKYFIDLTPRKLLYPGPTAIVTYAKGEINNANNFNPNTAAFASGTYVFFNDQSFMPDVPMADKSIDAAYNTFMHELTHVAQFNETTDKMSYSDIKASNELRYTWIDIIIKSNLIKEFAKISGWENISGDYKLQDSSKAKTTQYGKTKVYEDMAETVAGIASGRKSEFSTGRVNWGLKYLKTEISTLEKNKFPYSNVFEQVNATNLQYDTNIENEFVRKYKYSDRQVFVDSKIGKISALIDYFNQQLPQRDFAGEIKLTDNSNIWRYKGLFNGKNRDIYIEMYTYDFSKGYIVKPQGTIIVVINGYLQK